MVVHHWQHNIRMNIFSDETSFSKTVLIDILLSDDVSINFFFSVPFLSYTLGVFTYQIHHYSTSTYQLYQCSSTYHYLSTWFSSLSNLESSDKFHRISEVLAIACRFLDVVNAGCHL